jgi:hypothetical protein
MSSPDIKISKNLQAVAKRLTDELDGIAGEHVAFSLIVFNTQPGSRMNYVANCERTEVMGAMKSLLLKWENGMPDMNAHEIN